MKTDRRTLLRSVGGTLATAGVLGTAGTAAAAGSYTNHYYDGFDYWKYVPDSAGSNPPLVVMLHGCSQSADQFRRETRMNDVADESLVEYWQVDGMDHAWSGGASGGEFTAPGGPDASRIIWEFVSGHTRGE